MENDKQKQKTMQVGPDVEFLVRNIFQLFYLQEMMFFSRGPIDEDIFRITSTNLPRLFNELNSSLSTGLMHQFDIENGRFVTNVHPLPLNNDEKVMLKALSTIVNYQLNDEYSYLLKLFGISDYTKAFEEALKEIQSQSKNNEFAEIITGMPNKKGSAIIKKNHLLKYINYQIDQSYITFVKDYNSYANDGSKMLYYNYIETLVHFFIPRVGELPQYNDLLYQSILSNLSHESLLRAQKIDADKKKQKQMDDEPQNKKEELQHEEVQQQKEPQHEEKLQQQKEPHEEKLQQQEVQQHEEKLQQQEEQHEEKLQQQEEQQQKEQHEEVQQHDQEEQQQEVQQHDQEEQQQKEQHDQEEQQHDQEEIVDDQHINQEQEEDVQFLNLLNENNFMPLAQEQEEYHQENNLNTIKKIKPVTRNDLNLDELDTQSDKEEVVHKHDIYNDNTVKKVKKLKAACTDSRIISGERGHGNDYNGRDDKGPPIIVSHESLSKAAEFVKNQAEFVTNQAKNIAFKVLVSFAGVVMSGLTLYLMKNTQKEKVENSYDDGNSKNSFSEDLSNDNINVVKSEFSHEDSIELSESDQNLKRNEDDVVSTSVEESLTGKYIYTNGEEYVEEFVFEEQVGVSSDDEQYNNGENISIADLI